MRLRLLVCVLLTIFALSVPAITAEPPLEITLRESTGIRVNGRLNDWPSARCLEIGRKTDVTRGSVAWVGEEAFSAKVFLSYDSDCLYLAAVVREEHSVAGAVTVGPPTGDSLEFTLSSGWDHPRPSGWTRRDVSVILAPGQKSKTPIAWLPARGMAAPGARVVAKNTPTGYLLEASLPWSLFPGLKVGPGRKARFRLVLDGSGILGEDGVYQLEMGRGKPAEWPWVRFDGDAVAEGAEKTSDRSDPDAARIDEGLGGATSRGERSITGRVVDAKGRPVGGAWVWTWPVSSQAWTEADGTFTLPKAKIYDRTVLLASGEDWGTGVAPLTSSGAVTLPEAEPPRWGWGYALETILDSLPYPGCWWALRPIAEVDGNPVEKVFSEWARFEGMCREAGGESFLFLGPGAAVARMAASGAKYWGLLAPDTDAPPFDYLNAYRAAYLSLKKAKPGAWVMGAGYSPERANQERCFLRFNGDVADMTLVRAKVSLDSGGDVSAAARALRRAEKTLSLRRREVASQLDRAAPMAILLAMDVSEEPKGGIGPALFLASLLASWAGDPPGPLFLDWGGQAPPVETPLGRMTELLCDFQGEALGVHDVQPGTRVAARRALDGRVWVLVVNETLRQATTVRLSLSGKKGSPSVDAGRDEKLEFSVPAKSAALVGVPVTGKAQGKWYGFHQAARRETIQELVIR